MGAGDDELRRENERLKQELERFRKRDAAAGAGGRARIRGTVSVVLAVLTAVSLVSATVGVWTSRTVWNQEKFMERVAPVIKRPAVRDAMATELTDQVFVALDVQNRVSAALVGLSDNTEVPEQATFLAGPLTEGMRGLVHDQVAEFIASDTFYGYWTAALRQLHPKMVDLLEGDYSQLPNVSVSGGQVQLNLVPIVAQILQDLVQEGFGALGINVTVPDIPANAPVDEAQALLASKLGISLPDDFGVVTVMTETQLTGMQAAANGLRLLAWGLSLLTLLLAAASIAVAPKRRMALGWLGVASALGILLGFSALRSLKSSILDSIATGQARRVTLEIFTQLVGELRYAAKGVFWASVIVAVVALILSRPATLDLMANVGRSFGGSGRDMGASRGWVARHAGAARGWSSGIAAIALSFTGLSLLTLLVIGGLLAVVLIWIASAQNDASEVPGRPFERIA